MKALRSMVLTVVIACSLMGCTMTKSSLRDSQMFLDNTVTVVIIPGAGEYNAAVMKKWQDAFPAGSVIIIPRKHWPLYSGAEDIALQIREKGITGRVIIIGLSYGGNLGCEFDASFPGVVIAVSTVGSPTGGVKFMPDWPESWSIKPRDRNSKTPLFAVVGVKPGIPRPMWMDDPSDGTVGYKQATDNLLNRKVKEIAVFEDEHSALFEDDNVIAWVRGRINPFLKPKQQPTTLVASMTAKKEEE